MKNLATVFSSLALIGVIILFILHFSDNKPAGTTSAKTNVVNTSNSLKIAYVDIDSFEANYDYLKAKRADFEKRQTAAESELQRSAQQYQSTLQSLQQKAQTMTEAEGKAAEKQLMQMQQSLQLREQSLSEEIGKEKESFNKQLQNDLDSFLADYNKDKGYAYILSYSKAINMILYADKDMDITRDVIKGMNERAANKKDASVKK